MRALDITIAGGLLLAGMGLFVMTFSPSFDVPTFGGDVGPAFAPRGYLLVWIALAAITLVQALRSQSEPSEDPGNLPRLIITAAIGAVTGFAMLHIGFVLAAIPGFFAFCYALGYRRLAVLAIISIGVPLAIWVLFTFGFELLLPRSPWFGRL